MTDSELIDSLQPLADAGGTNQSATTHLRCVELGRVLVLAREALAVQNVVDPPIGSMTRELVNESGEVTGTQVYIRDKDNPVWGKREEPRQNVRRK